MDKNKTEVILVVDRSGSMHWIARGMEGAIDTFIAEQRKVEGECLVTLAQFDDEYQIIYSARDVRRTPPARIEARGSTALLDAIGRTISEVGVRLAATDESQRPGRVIVVVVTDGYENASREYNGERIKDMISHQTAKYNWDFIFLGATQAAVTAAVHIGIFNNAVMDFNAAGAQAFGKSVSNSVTESRVSGERAIYNQITYNSVQTAPLIAPPTTPTVTVTKP